MRIRSIMVMVVWGLKKKRLGKTHPRATTKGVAPTTASPPCAASPAAEKPATAKHSRLKRKYASKSFACARPNVSLVFDLYIYMERARGGCYTWNGGNAAGGGGVEVFFFRNSAVRILRIAGGGGHKTATRAPYGITTAHSTIYVPIIMYSLELLETPATLTSLCGKFHPAYHKTDTLHTGSRGIARQRCKGGKIGRRQGTSDIQNIFLLGNKKTKPERYKLVQEQPETIFVAV